MNVTELIRTFITYIPKAYPLVQGVFFAGYGAKELVADGVIANYKIAPLSPTAAPTTKAAHKIRSFMAKFNFLHGPLYMASAAASIVSELHTLNLINVGPIAPILNPISNILFIGACALAIGQQIYLLTTAKSLPPEKAKPLRVSCTLGIIGNVGYIAAVGAIFLAAPIALSIILGAIALAIGIIKFFYDYYKLNLE